MCSLPEARGASLYRQRRRRHLCGTSFSLYLSHSYPLKKWESGSGHYLFKYIITPSQLASLTRMCMFVCHDKSACIPSPFMYINSFALCFLSMHVAYLERYITAFRPCFIPLERGVQEEEEEKKNRLSSCHLGIGEERKREEAGTCACNKSAKQRPYAWGGMGTKGSESEKRRGRQGPQRQ